MSFILDALRKSETERRREAAPNLHHVPLAVHREGVPVWIWSTIALLALSVMVLGGAWWQSTRERGDQAQARTAREAQPPAATGLVPAASPESAPPAVPTVSPATDAPRPEVDVQQGIRTLPSLEQAVAEGLALPPLELQLLSYSEDAAERFVFINGFQYRQGQRVQNGPLIVAIYSEGVVMRHGGRDFALLPK